MKRVLLASSALTLLAAMGQAQAKDLYVSVLGGANWMSDSSSTTGGEGSTGHTFDADTGFLVGAAIGTSLDNWVRGLRTEMEVSYRRNDVGGNWFTNDFETLGVIDGNFSTFAIMANLWYDIDVGSKFRPYVGGGAGWARSHFDAAFLTTITGTDNATTGLNEVRENDNSGFAYQLGVGINYEVMPGVDAGIGYRFFEGPRIPTYFEDDSTLRIDNENHTVFINVTVGID